MEEDVIVVTGIRRNNAATDSSLEGRVGNLVPLWWSQTSHFAWAGPAQITEANVILTSSDKRLDIAGLNFDLVIPKDIWDALPLGLRKAITTLATNWSKSPSASEALQHVSDRGVLEVQFDIRELANNAFAQIEYRSDNESGDRTQITAGTKMKIIFDTSRLEDSKNVGEEAFMNTLVHEFWHPKAPDVNGFGSDHPVVEAKAAAAVREIYGMNYSSSSSPVSDNGKAVLGSHVNDTILGSDRNDALSGMGGDDYISAGSGSNIMYGGLGNDHLVSSGVNDLIAGGLGFDTYTITPDSVNAVVRDDGGFDTIEFYDNISNYHFYRDNANLHISRNNGVQSTAIVEGFFNEYDVNAIDEFRFAGAGYAASHITYLMNGGSGGYEHDQPIGYRAISSSQSSGELPNRYLDDTSGYSPYYTELDSSGFNGGAVYEISDYWA